VAATIPIHENLGELGSEEALPVPLTHTGVGAVHALPPQRIVIAGGPGSGKSSLLRALAASGEICYEEASRELIREQLAHAGRLLPWGDLWGFAMECGERMHAQLTDSARHGRCFFDRGLPDLTGYLSHGGRTAPDAWRVASHAYAAAVFFAPPWREIYVNDPERPQTFAEAQSLSAHVRRAYLDCGFRLIELVKSSVPDRLRQVLHYLDAHQHEPQHR
jgi:predicted ATPase